MDYLVKFIIFALFVSVLYFVIDLFISFLTPYLQALYITPLLCQFGLFTALNIFISILVAGWFIRHVLNFWK